MALGIYLLQHHRRDSRRWLTQASEESDRVEKAIQGRRYIRRMQVSALLVFVGALIPLTDWALAILKRPLIATLLVLLILGVVLWIALLALSDLFDANLSKARSQAKLKQLKRHQEELVDELQRYHDRKLPETDR